MVLRRTWSVLLVLFIVCLILGLRPTTLYALSSDNEAPANTPTNTSEHNVLDAKFMSVSWTNTSTDTTYVQGLDDDEIQAITSGVWRLDLVLNTVVDEDILQNGVYEYYLSWPSGDVVLTRIDDDQTTEDITWSLDVATGLMTITIDMPPDAGSSTYTFWEHVTVGAGDVGGPEGEEPVSPSLEKVGIFDAIAQAIEWNITATIPAYGSGKYNTWAIDDQEDYSGTYGSLGDLSHVSVSISSNDFSGAGQPIDEAGPDDDCAYALFDEGNNAERLYLLNRCSCTPTTCNYWGNDDDGCGSGTYIHRVNGQTVSTSNHTFTDAAGDKWCDCWHCRYNVVATVNYMVDATTVLQNLQNKDLWDSGLTVNNTAYVYKDEDQALAPCSAYVTLQKLLTKTETVAADKDNAFVGSFEITVNPHHYDYDATDSLTITDTMDNLAYLLGSIEVTSDGTALQCVNDPGEAHMQQSADVQDNRYAFTITDVTDGEAIIGKTLAIQIFEPTNRAYTISYDAAVIDPSKNTACPYTNTAVLGDVYASINASSFDYGAAYLVDTKQVAVHKVDEDDHAVVLEGAQFEVYRFSERGEDILLSTLSTASDGTTVFKTDRPAGYVIAPNTLYYLVETEAPNGYELNEHNTYWFYFKEGDGVASLPDGLESNEVWTDAQDFGDGYETIVIPVSNKAVVVEEPQQPVDPQEPQQPVDPQQPQDPVEPQPPVNPDTPPHPDSPDDAPAGPQNSQSPTDQKALTHPNALGSAHIPDNEKPAEPDKATALVQDTASVQTDDPTSLLSVIVPIAVAASTIAATAVRREWVKRMSEW